ncbi:Deoxyribonuclease-1 [Dissostichus eleginoides]|uniref:Deoxyribonuclease-1 n=1 Tax=Dissostichus eleginoides TaxID=100907 RepID=A0AAD9FLB2_DISEL|nr:Deoxyribonuclease-1 [Dissostichus eleginoides]
MPLGLVRRNSPEQRVMAVFRPQHHHRIPNSTNSTTDTSRRTDTNAECHHDTTTPRPAALKVELLAAVRQDERTKNGAGYLMDGAALAGGLQWQV